MYCVSFCQGCSGEHPGPNLLLEVNINNIPKLLNTDFSYVNDVLISN